MNYAEQTSLPVVINVVFKNSGYVILMTIAVTKVMRYTVIQKGAYRFTITPVIKKIV